MVVRTILIASALLSTACAQVVLCQVPVAPAQASDNAALRITTLRWTVVRVAPSDSARAVGSLWEAVFYVDSLDIRNGYLAVPKLGPNRFLAARDVRIVPVPRSAVRDSSLKVHADTILDGAYAARFPFPIEYPAAPPGFDMPPNAALRTFQRGDFAAMLIEPMEYKVGRTRQRIVVPAGFVTDFASVPREFWSEFPTTGEYKLAAVIHDYLYWEQQCTRPQADNLFLIAMTEQGVSRRTREFLHLVVRQWGQRAWDRNRTERKQGMPKFIPVRYRQVSGGMSWEEHRLLLMDVVRRGAHELSFLKELNPGPPDAGYCLLGDRPEVP